MSNETMENFDLDELIEELLQLVEEKKYRQLKAALLELNEVDIALFIEELEPDRTVVVFRMLPKSLAAEVFAELEIEAPTAKDKGRIMKVLMPLVKGKADGKVVNEILAGMMK